MKINKLVLSKSNLKTKKYTMDVEYELEGK